MGVSPDLCFTTVILCTKLIVTQGIASVNEPEFPMVRSESSSQEQISGCNRSFSVMLEQTNLLRSIYMFRPCLRHDQSSIC